MTVTNSSNKSGPYVGDGAATSFAFTGKKVFDATDLVVVRVNADDTESILVKDSDYTVSLNADQEASPGGSITYPISGTALSSSEYITILREVDEKQQTDITNLGGFYPNIIENMADRSAMFAQQNEERGKRSVRMSRGATAAQIASMELAASERSKYLYIDSSGNLAPVSDTVGTSALTQALIGLHFYPRIQAEIDVLVTPTNYYYPVLNVLRYGADNTGATDSTTAIRAALSVAEQMGGGTVLLPAGTYNVETTASPRHCLSIPENVHFRGESQSNTFLGRLAANIEEESILISNKDSDTAVGYAGASNITISDLTISDCWDAERSQSNGDLIAFGHCRLAVVRDCWFARHTQHCVDIAGSKNIKVIDCVEYNVNGATGYAANAAVQVDRAVAGAFLDINADDTESKDITIHDNHFSSTYTNEIIHVGHNGGTAHNIIITENHLYGSARSYASLIRCDQTGSSIDGLIISDNIITCTTLNNAAIAIDCDGNLSESLKNIKITGNIIKGLGRIGIYVGGTSDFADSTFPDFQNIIIADNNIELTTTGSAVSAYGIWVALCENVKVHDNNVHLTRDTDTIAHYGINLTSCLAAKAKDNSVKTTLSGSYVGSVTSAAIALGRFGSILTTTPFVMEASGNDVDVSAFKYGLLAEGMDSLGIDKPRFSSNTFVGALTNGLYHIYETVPASDGTNGIMDIDFGAGALFKLVAVDETYSLTPGLKKAGTTNVQATPSYFGLTYAPGASSALATASEALLTNQADIGLQIQNYDATAGTFDIVTGSAGTQLSIVDGGADTTQSAGHIRCRFGI